MIRASLQARIATRVFRPASRDGAYRGRLWFVALAFVAVACCGPWLDIADACPDPDDETSRGYPYDPQGEEITVKFVFISFPGSDQTELRESIHKRFTEKFAEYFTAISNGKLTFSDASGILFKYIEIPEGGYVLDTFDNAPEDTTAVPWMADLGATHYEQNPNCPPGHPEYQAHHLTQEYLQEWEGRVGSWWVTDIHGQPVPNLATELAAEILWKICENYLANGVNALEQIDSLQLIFLHSDDSPFYDGVGGRPDVHVVADAVERNTAPFYSQLGRSGSVYEGTIQGGGSLWDRSVVPHRYIGYTHEFIDNAVRVICHEFAHTLGPGDGPPSLVSVCQGFNPRWCEERYYYGTLNLLDQHRVRRSAIAPISTPWMATLPWREVVDFTGHNLRNVQLDDLMLGGKIYKYQLAWNEMMLITYRAGNGVDGWLGADGLPALKSHGVEIWHVAGNVHDLESHVKLWNIDELTPAVYTWEDAMVHPGLAEDPVDGYDNYDLWLASDGIYREPEEYGQYAGDADDFFPPVTGGGPAYVAYSWDTNPNCFGYSRQPEHAGLYRRRRPQIESSSLEVTIREIVGNGDAVIIDLVSAPFEDITYPDESVMEPFTVNDTVPITWTTDYATGDHTIALTLDLYYLPLASSPELRFPIPGGQGIAATAANQPFNWTIQATDPSEDAAILAVFHNEYSEHVHEVMSATFEVAGVPVLRELLLQPAAGAEWISGLEYQVRWTDAYDHSTFAGVSIQYRIDGASAWYDLATDLTEGVGGYTYDQANDENYYTLGPDNAMASSGGQLRLRYEYYVDGGGTATSYSDVHEPIAVYPVATQFADQTANIDTGYEGLPSSFAPVVTGASGNDLGGVVVAIREATRPSMGELYFVSTHLSDIQLQRRTITYLPSSILPVGMTGLSIADYDGDGDDDIFACWPSGGGITSKLLTLNESQYQEINGQGLNPFQGISSELLQNAQCASWIDYDHDGDLDLYVGRALVELGDPNDPNGDTADKLTPLRDCLFENDGGVFSEVGISVGLVDPLESEATKFAIWADCDHDGQWELLVGGGDGGYGTKYFREVSYRLFEPQDTSPIAGTSIIDARWVDVDNDGFLDVVGLSPGNVVVSLGQAGGALGPLAVAAAFANSGSFAVLDYDLDGWRDLIVKSSGTSSYGLLANYLEDPLYPSSFVDISAATGVEGAGVAIAAFPSDLDQDGDLDLMVGRASCSTGTLLANELRDPVSGGSQHYVSLRLVSGIASGAYGATVILRDVGSNLLGIQVVEGGGNRESQANRDLVFGLGGYDGAATAEIHWPLGRVQSYPISANDIDQLVTIVEPVIFAIDDNSVKFTMLLRPDGKIMWQFDWTTDHWTAAALDQVAILGDPDGCLENSIVLHPGDSDVEHSLTYIVDAGGDGIYYHHRLTYTNAPCDPSCVIEYSVGSSNGMGPGLVESSGHTGRTPKLCPLSL
jgi:hypothetical protein